MASRRGLLAGAFGVAAMMLVGCVPWSTQSRVNRAAQSVDGVESSDLSVGTGGTFGPIIYGEVHCSVDEPELADVFDAAWREVVVVLRDAGDDGREVQGVSAVGSDGSTVTPSRWLPETERDTVAVRDFYDRYELG